MKHRIDIVDPTLGQFSLLRSEVLGCYKLAPGVHGRIRIPVAESEWVRYAAQCGELIPVGENSDWGAGNLIDMRTPNGG